MKKRLLLLLLLLGPLGAAAQVRFETKSTDAVREMALRSGKLVLINRDATSYDQRADLVIRQSIGGVLESACAHLEA